MAMVKPVGGVRRVELFRPCHVAIVRRASQTEIEVSAEAEAVEVELTEDCSQYDERLRLWHGLRSVVHELQLTALRSDAAPWLDEEFLRRAEAEGVAARAEMMSGEVIWIGISRRFGTAQPLYIAAIESTSELSPRQRPTVRLTLVGEDCDFALRQRD